MRSHIFNKLMDFLKPKPQRPSYLRYISSGSFVNLSSLSGNSTITDIRNKIETMRGLAQDSQISTALSYYATDATTTNTSGKIIWATSEDEQLTSIINKLFDRWNINAYARDHILELATVGNLYIPTTNMYRDPSSSSIKHGVALDNNTIMDNNFDIIPSYNVSPEDIIHIWSVGDPKGYVYQPDSENSAFEIFPESAVIHFSLGGLLGNYTIDCKNTDGSISTYDIQFAEPLLGAAVTPTTVLNLLENANILSSLTKIVRFINVDCSGEEEEEIASTLQQIKDTIEQQMSINTNTGDAQSYLNPQSPNNLIYLPKVNGQDAISITDLNMAATTDADNSLLDYYQNKKLSVLGIPKEALNYSSNEGLGAAGTVMSQRSALYANILDRLMTAYKAGWTKALNTYFTEHRFSGYVDKFQLHMNPIITTQSTIQFEKRDAALSQAQTLVALMKDIGIIDSKDFRKGLTEILVEAFPTIGSDVTGWDINIESGGGSDEF